MSLISKKDVFKAILLNIGRKGFFKLLVQSTKVKRINQFYQKHQYDDTETFINAVFIKSNLQLTFNTNELQRVPKNIPCIVISNHPFGGIDGLILYLQKVIRKAFLRLHLIKP